MTDDGAHSPFTCPQSFYNIFRLLGFVPGLEFKVAMTEAKKLNIPVVYGDQEGSVQMTPSPPVHVL